MRRRLNGATRAGVRPLADFRLAEKLALACGWRPPGQDEPRPASWTVCRWASWPEYLGDFASVESELRARFPRREPFAARARAYADRHGIEALSRASYAELRGED